MRSIGGRLALLLLNFVLLAVGLFALGATIRDVFHANWAHAAAWLIVFAVARHLFVRVPSE